MKESPLQVLEKYWGFTNFRGSQEKIVNTVLLKKDVVALLPTGGGKSVCFQVPALVFDGICIVISPLVALIHDQVEALKQKGIKALALTGGISTDELITILDNCIYGNYKFLYVSPERIQQELVLNKIKEMNVSLIAVDEAHCISQWGHDFRPAYLSCSILKDIIPNTPTIALTATATSLVTKDIIAHLAMQDAIVFKDSFARKNIAFTIVQTQDKKYLLEQACKEAKSSCIVYVSTRRSTLDISNHLQSKGLKADFYHGGLDKNSKKKKLNQWLTNDIKIMVSTNAFGMGIDKADVDLVVHYQIPDCLENYFQEAGRAGRNGAPAKALLLTNPNDEERAKKQFLSVLPDTTLIKKIYNKLNNYFQISYGELVDEPYQFNLYSFCHTYQLNTLLTYNTLRILDQNSVISLTESFSKKTEIKFICSKHTIFNYLDRNSNIAATTQTILRTYGGVFEFDTKINTHSIAKKTGVAENVILKHLEQLKKDELITYKAQSNDLEINFLVPREDDTTINLFAKNVTAIHKTKVDKLTAMLAYTNNTSQCRAKVLVMYFGEQTTEDCGKCDICNASKIIDTSTVEENILQLLAQQSFSSRDIIAKIPFNSMDVLNAIRNLLEDEKIKINSINEYERIV